MEDAEAAATRGATAPCGSAGTLTSSTSSLWSTTSWASASSLSSSSFCSSSFCSASSPSCCWGYSSSDSFSFSFSSASVPDSASEISSSLPSFAGRGRTLYGYRPSTAPRWMRWRRCQEIARMVGERNKKDEARHNAMMGSSGCVVCR